MAVTPSAPAPAEDARIAELYRARSTEEPPARLDIAIRAAARGGEADRARKASWWTAWRMPFAVASVAVVSATLAIMVREERPEPFAESPAIAVVPPGSAPAPTPEPAPDAPASRSPDLAQKRNAEAGKAASAIQAPARMPSAQPQVAPEAPAELSGLSRQDASADTAAAREAPAASAADRAPRKEGRAASSGTIGLRGLEAENVSRDRVNAESKPATPPAPGVAPPAPMGAPAAQVPRAKLEAYGAVDIASLKAELEREPPRRWVERIAALRCDGRAAEADALAAEFRRRFPNESLPE